MKEVQETNWKIIWESNDYAPQEMIDSFGTDAVELFRCAILLTTCLEQMKSGYLDPKVLTAGKPYQINENGTVTII